MSIPDADKTLIERVAPILSVVMRRLREAEQALTLMGDMIIQRDALIERLEREKAEAEQRLNTPELHDFSAAVVLEAAHQRSRWGADHDAGKEAEDWFWLLGYLGGKALRAAKDGDIDKALHHTISAAAAMANWHASLSGANTEMRPGIDPAEARLSYLEAASDLPMGMDQSSALWSKSLPWTEHQMPAPAPFLWGVIPPAVRRWWPR